MEMKDIERAKREVLKAGHELVALGLVARTWGNVSCRISDRSFAITPSGIGYDRLDEDSIVIVNVDTLEHVGDVKPSSEKGIHAAAYKIDPDVNFVIHTHQTYATCISVSGFDLLDPTVDELNLLGGEIGLGAYAISSTKKLTKIVAAEFAQGKHAILMAKHGAVLTGTDRDEAFKRSTLLEGICHRSMKGLPDFDDSPSEPDEKSKIIMSSIQGAYPQFKSIMILDSDVVNASMEKKDVVPAIIDDFAQMVGGDIKSTSDKESHDAVRKLKGRNAIYVKGVGALCCAGNDSDAKAVMTLVEKNALSFLNAEKNGDTPGLSFFDKKLMRFVYTKKYSKKI